MQSTARKSDYQTPRRMSAKLAAVPLPGLQGKKVLDVGCEAGFWTFLTADKGADFVLGLDRNREVSGFGYMDLIALNRGRAEDEGRSNVKFENVNVGRQWLEFGTFDAVLVLSVYHHIFENCGDHSSIWYWLRRHCAVGAQILWEGPVDDSDPVVRANVSRENRGGYTRERILDAASTWFEPQYVGPALHEPTREVWRFWPLGPEPISYSGTVRSGAGGAAAAFLHAGGRRIEEIRAVLGYSPFPGSLNVTTAGFHWNFGYYRAAILDVVERGKGLDVEWRARWARFYPLTVNGIAAHAFRFEGERYPDDFVELIAPVRLRDAIGGEKVRICRGVN